MTEPRDWGREGGEAEYVKDQRLILSELKRFNSWLNEIDTRLNTIENRMSVQEVKGGMWGAIASIITLAVLLGVNYLLRGVK